MNTTRLAVLLFTDIVGSTELKSKIGTAAYALLLARHNELFETGLRECAGAEIIKHTGDGYFVTLPTASDAVRFALRFQTRMKLEAWKPQPIATRVGIHIGEVQLMDMAGRADVLGLSADIAARIMSLATGGQILLTASAFNDARQFVNRLTPSPGTPGEGGGEGSAVNPQSAIANPQLEWIAHGPYLFKGSDEPLDVFEVGIEGFSPLVRPLDSEKVKRVVPHDQEPTLGWRPAIGLEIPNRPGWFLERKLGDGGFGEVWLGVHGKLKHERRVFKFCFDVDRLRSFKRELTLFRLLREALGERDDIATLYEVQLNEPPFYLESEYTEGGNLLEWSERKGGIDKIPLNERLEMVAKIADAVAAAHSVGVLHKDIKPTNVLIHESDGKVQPRLADFGIGILSDRTQLQNRAITETGFTVLTQNDSSRTGTRMYAPPESLLNKPFTTQGDVYAVGILMYQMVVGDLTRPLAPGWERGIGDEFITADIVAMVEGDVSLRIGSAAAISRRIRSLDTRRAEQAADRANASARARRRRRFRLMLATTTVLSAMLVIGTVTTWFYVQGLRAEQERTRVALHEARVQKAEAERQQGEAQRQKAEAQTQAAIANAISQFQNGVLNAAAVDNGQITLASVIEKMAMQLDEGGLATQPLAEACAREAIGATLYQLGRRTDALAQMRGALDLRRTVLPPNDLTLADSIAKLGGYLQSSGLLDEAETLYREALAIHRTMKSSNSNVSCYRLGRLLQRRAKLAEAEACYREALSLCNKSPSNPITREIVQTLAETLELTGENTEAAALRAKYGLPASTQPVTRRRFFYDMLGPPPLGGFPRGENVR